MPVTSHGNFRLEKRCLYQSRIASSGSKSSLPVTARIRCSCSCQSFTTFSDAPAFTSRQFDGIARIGDNADAEPQVVSSQAVGQLVPLPLDVDRARVPQGLFDGVDSHVSGANTASKQLRQRRLSARRESREYV